MLPTKQQWPTLRRQSCKNALFKCRFFSCLLISPRVHFCWRCPQYWRVGWAGCQRSGSGPTRAHRHATNERHTEPLRLQVLDRLPLRKAYRAQTCRRWCCGIRGGNPEPAARDQLRAPRGRQWCARGSDAGAGTRVWPTAARKLCACLLCTLPLAAMINAAPASCTVSETDTSIISRFTL